MTIGQKMHQTLAQLQSLAGDLKSYALETQDQTAKQQFSDYANQLENIANGFRGRVNYIEQQEPQYKVLQQQQQQQKQ
ncbi:MAG: DUF1657 domain-containing protein [Peptococcaceae bacterium]|nr:DUF1657 domain-containing protein [Peptococcaceae bacterium]